MTEHFDVVVVGAGSSGAVVANRLSESPDRRVLLLEAGPDFTRTSLPSVVTDASCPTVEFDWGYKSEPSAGTEAIGLPRAKLVGGCSATNATFALRGSPTDYDEWAAAGNHGWSFADVLPYFCKVETDHDFDGEWHGRSGLVPIRRVRQKDLRPHQHAALEAAFARGHDAVDDHNRPHALGAGPTPRNLDDGVRVSTAIAYVEPARQRSNFTVRADTLVDGVLADNGRARGVRLLGGGEVEGDTIVLAAGAYGSPAILLRSGMGPANDLRSLGIDVVADLPGVGSNLIDHPAVSVDVDVGAAADAPGDWFQTAITWRSERAGTDPYDVHLIPGGPINDVFFFLVGLMRPKSRGDVALRSRDPNAPPRIRTGGLDAAVDLARMIEGVRHARELLHTPPLRELITGPELKLGLDANDDEELTRAIRRELSVYHHACGTCAMGMRPEEGAVVDNEGRVHGVEGLLVADASIMPMIPAANTNLPAMMIGERIAATMTA